MRPAAKSRLEILDAHGKLIRRFSSREKAPKPPGNVPIAPRWFAPPQALSEEAGMHRFVWDLRYGRTGQTSEFDEEEGAQRWNGPLALPGSYKIKLTVNGRESVQPLEVAMDPRAHITPADLLLQFHWAQRAFEDMIAARKAASEIRGLQAQLDKAKSSLNENHKALLDSIAATQRASAELLTLRKQETDQGLESASRAFGVILQALEGADRTPPSQVIATYRDTSKTLQARLADWNKLKQDTLPGLNQQLREAGVAPVQISQLEQEAEENVTR